MPVKIVFQLGIQVNILRVNIVFLKFKKCLEKKKMSWKLIVGWEG